MLTPGQAGSMCRRPYLPFAVHDMPFIGASELSSVLFMTFAAYAFYMNQLSGTFELIIALYIPFAARAICLTRALQNTGGALSCI